MQKKGKDRSSIEDKVRRMTFHCPAEISDNVQADKIRWSLTNAQRHVIQSYDPVLMILDNSWTTARYSVVRDFAFNHSRVSYK